MDKVFKQKLSKKKPKYGLDKEILLKKLLQWEHSYLRNLQALQNQRVRCLVLAKRESWAGKGEWTDSMVHG